MRNSNALKKTVVPNFSLSFKATIISLEVFLVMKAAHSAISSNNLFLLKQNNGDSICVLGSTIKIYFLFSKKMPCTMAGLLVVEVKNYDFNFSLYLTN